MSEFEQYEYPGGPFAGEVSPTDTGVLIVFRREDESAPLVTLRLRRGGAMGLVQQIYEALH